MNEQDQRPALRGLDLRQAPPRDLWPQIAMRLAPRRRRARRWQVALAASLLLALALPLVWQWRPAPPATLAPPAPLVRSDLDAVPGSRALVKAHLKLSQDSARQIRRALRQQPDSAALQRLLQTTENRNTQLRQLLAQAT